MAPSVRVRKAPAAPNVFKPKKENENLDKSSRNLTDSERVAREKALANAKIKDETEKLSKKEKVVKKKKLNKVHQILLIHLIFLQKKILSW